MDPGSPSFRTFGLPTERRSAPLRPNPAGRDVGSRDQNIPISSASVHSVPFSMAIPNTAAPNTAVPGRLEQMDNNFSMIFRRKYERLDWRKIAAIDLEKIYKSQDTRTLQENLTQLAFFDLEEELRSVDINPQFGKLFQAMQFSLEYLLYVQDHLQRELDGVRSTSVTLTRNQETDIQALSEEVANLKKIVQSSRDELKKRKRMMIAQQEIINNAAKGNYHKCPLCEKAFIERNFLETHFRRRHPNGDWSLLCGQLPTPGSSKSEELGSAKERIRALEQQLNDQKACPVLEAPVAISAVPPLILEMYNKQGRDVEQLKEALTDIQAKYLESQKALAALKNEWQNISEKESTTESPREVAEVFEKRVIKLQETLELRLQSSEDAWKDKLVHATEQHRRDLKDMEHEMVQKATEQQTAHKAEKLQLQMVNEEQERRIKQLESQLNAPRPQPRPQITQPRREPGFRIQQIKVQTNRGGLKSNRWGKALTPRVSAAMDSFPTMVNELRDELADALDTKLEEYGIRRGSTMVSDREKEQVFTKLRQEHSQLQGKLAKYGAARSTIENHMRDRPPAQYSSADLLDEANKIRVRTRTGRQVVSNNDSPERVAEVSTYNVGPEKPSDASLVPIEDIIERSSDPRKVTFTEHSRGSTAIQASRRSLPPPVQEELRSSRRSLPSPSKDDGRSSVNELPVRAHTITRSRESSPRMSKKQDDGAWFTDEDD